MPEVAMWDFGSVVHERVQKNAFIEHVHFYENDGRNLMTNNEFEQ